MNTTREQRRVVLRCNCGGCDTPFAEIQNGVIVIHSRHGGDRHTNVIRLEEVSELLKQATMQQNEERAILARSET